MSIKSDYYSREVLKMGKTVDMVVFDIDGVLTDGNIIIDANGNESKRYKLTEIDALNDIKKSGFLIAAITGEDTPIVDRFRKLVEWDSFTSGCKNKTDELKRIVQDFNLEIDKICYIGDGKYDIGPIKQAGLGVCPQNAIQDVKDVADVVLNGRGGESCIYELNSILVDTTKN